MGPGHIGIARLGPGEVVLVPLLIVSRFGQVTAPKLADVLARLRQLFGER